MDKNLSEEGQPGNQPVKDAKLFFFFCRECADFFAEFFENFGHFRRLSHRHRPELLFSVGSKLKLVSETKMLKSLSL